MQPRRRKPLPIRYGKWCRKSSPRRSRRCSWKDPGREAHVSTNAEADESAIIRPRLTGELFGHADAERTLLDAYRSGRIPHAWLIGGERGIGKATLAYRMARFVLAYPDSAMPAVQKAQSLAVPADHPAARRVAGQSHSDLLVLR